MKPDDIYRAAFESQDEAILLLQGDRIAEANASARRLLARPGGSLVGREISSLSPPAQPNGRAAAEMWREKVQGAASGAPQRYSWTYLRSGGGLLHTDVKLVRLNPTDEGEPILRATIYEERNDRERFYALSIDLLGIAGTDGYFRELSPSWERVLGYTREELMAKPYIEFVHPDDIGKTATEAGASAQGTQNFLFENRYRRKDGSYRWLEWNSMSVLDEELIYFVARDITERKLAEQALRASEEKLRALFDALPQIVLTVDREARITSMNRVVEGVSLSAILGKSMYEYIAPEHHERVRKAVASVLATGRPARYEIFGQGPGGTTACYASHVSAIQSGQEVAGLLIVTEDVSHRKLLEEQLRESIQRLEAYAEELEGKNRLLAQENEARERTAALLRQQQESILALSTPIIQAWDGVLVLPIIGAVDSARATQIMEKLLEEIVRTQSRFAVLDLTGVQMVDGPTVDHLLQVARAASLLGSRCLLSGISPAVAQAIVAIDTETRVFRTFGALQDALRHALAVDGNRASQPRRRAS